MTFLQDYLQGYQKYSLTQGIKYLNEYIKNDEWKARINMLNTIRRIIPLKKNNKKYNFHIKFNIISILVNEY